ncbi:TonB-dependent receptor [Flavobacterium luteum]|uniref:TonB-dependent receptor n=1 Tax=Flavobacterium luteum TaxID=2026654 RepID=A0A7J5AF67_9FLAO|nr:TonB-dependent receptor plug domain-containing protein [Flavobacterium luteum]KAB1156133.1 TonB-dependent receptor [Flavobacterium luteum]
MLKKKYLIFCLLLFNVYLFSQNTISGKINNQENIPLEGSHIHIGKKTATSDALGNYIIKNVTNGKVKVHVSYIGYQSIDTLVGLYNDLVLNFKLKELTLRLNEINIIQSRNTINKSVLEQKIKTETIEKYSSQSLGDVLKEIAGVTALKTGSTIVKPVINGLYGNRVPVINNNIRMEDQQWGSEHSPSFDINAAAKITVIKGASGLQFGGDAVGGLVIIEPITVKKDTLFGKTILNFDSNGRAGSLSSSIHKGKLLGWSWNALGTFKYLGDRETPNYVLSNSGNREVNFSGDMKYSNKKYDFTGYYSYYNAQIGILRASHTGNANDLYNSINNMIPSVVKDFTYNIENPKQEVKHHILKANYNYYFDETASLAIQYAFQFNKRLEFDVRRGKNNDRPALDLDLKTHAVNIDYKKNVHDWSIKSGANTVLQDNFANPSTGIRPLIPSYSKIDVGLYSIVSHNFSDSFTLETGLRYDFSKIDATKFYFKSLWDEKGYNSNFADFVAGDYANQWLTKPTFTFHNISSSIGFHKVFENDLNWYTNLSYAARNPNPSELFSDGLHHSLAVIELGDLALDKETSLKISTTIQKKWNSFSVEINPYVNAIQNYMFLRPIGFETTIRGAFPVWQYEQTNARLAGIDTQTNWKINSHWNHSLAFAYVNGKDLTQNIPLIDISPFTANTKIQYSNVKWNHFLIEVKGELVGQQKQFPNNNYTTNIIVNNVLTPIEVDISTPPASYELLHMYSEVKFKTFHKAITTLAFSVQNILNTTYRDYLNRQRFFADEMGRNFQIQLKINY